MSLPLPRHHVDQIDVVADLGDGGPGDVGIEHRGHRRRGQPQAPDLILVDADAQLPAGLHPVEVQVPGPAMVGNDLTQIQGDLTQLVQVVAQDPVLDGPAHRGAKLQGGDPGDGLGDLLLEVLVELDLQPLAGGHVLGDHHRLGEEGVGQLDVERQVEAHRPPAHIGAPVGDVRVGAEQGIEPVGLPGRGMDRGVLGQADVHQQVGAVGGREELPRHQVHGPERDGEGGHGHRDGQPAQPDGAIEQGAVGPQQGPGLGLVGLGLGRDQEQHPEQGGEDHGHEPGDQQRDADHREDIEGVLAGRAGGKAHRDEAGDGDQGAGQHGEGQGPVGIGRRRLLGLADGELPGHGVHRGHGIVDQQGQGDDQGAQRDALQVDVQDVHDGEDGGQHQRDRQGHHGPGPHPQAQEAHRQDDGDGLPEGGGEVVDGRVHRLRLVGDPYRLDADGQIRD